MNYQHTALTALDDLILSFDRRLTTLEKSACSPASPAPSDGASASSGGTTLNPSTATGDGSSAAPTRPKSADAATVSSDPSAAIRADPNRPAWLTEAMLPLPVGTERVRRHKFKGGCTIGAFPSQKIWWDIPLEWSETRQVTEEDSPRWQDAEVYHVPPPQPEKPKPAAATIQPRRSVS